MAKRMAIRVKVFDRSEYVEITEEMLSDSEKFLRHVLQSFELDPSQAAQAYIFDQNNFRIPVDLYPVVMPQFLNSAVYIKLVFTLDENTGFDLTLEDFLKQNGCKAILLAAKQAHQLNEELDSKSIHRLAESAVHFMEYREEEGNKVEAQEVANSLVRLMPCIDMKTLYTGKKGILFNKLSYRKYKTSKSGKKTAKNDANGSDINNAIACVADQVAEMTIEDELSNLLFFKTCLVGRDIDILKIKMKQTIALREKTIRKRETKFIDAFPFYYVSPNLILFDYNIRFGGGDRLIAKWPKLKMNILKFLSKSDAEDCANFGFDENITCLLLLLRSFSMKKSFDLKVNKMIVYSQNVNTSPDDLIVKKNAHPYIIAVGINKNEISSYYIDIEESLIPVPSDLGSLEVFDIFFKCHKVFNIDYDPCFVRLMHFVDYYLFEEKESNEIDITVSMKKVAEKIQISSIA